MYSPYVFAIAHISSDIPYAIIGAILYWVLMVRLQLLPLRTFH